MHQRNPYRNGIDFVELAQSYDALQPHLISESNSIRKTIDFKDLEAQRRLTEAIMLRDFGVKLYIPLDRLCPPVPNRVNYILWIQDVMRAHTDVPNTQTTPVRGIDIGTGATAIYAFLACKMDSSWSMVATDSLSYQAAQRNIQENDIQSRIDLRKASPDGRILFALESERDTYHFTLCNPPFYSSLAEVDSLVQEKVLPPNAVCTGAPVEMIYEPRTNTGSGGALEEGGEAGFVGRMVEESVTFGTQCRWYTSMLGKLSSVLSVVGTLRKYNITNYAVTEFVQGQTRRWAVGWSFTDWRLPDSIARISPFVGPSHALYAALPPRNTLATPLPRPTFHASDMPRDPASHRDEFHSRVVQVLQEALEDIDDVRATRIPLSTASSSNDFALSPTSRPPEMPSSSVFPPPPPATPFDEDPIHIFNSPRPPSRVAVALFFVEAMRNTWSRAARRKAKGKVEAHTNTGKLFSVKNDAPSTILVHPSSTSGTPNESRGGIVTGPTLTCSVRVIMVLPHGGVAETGSTAAIEDSLELEFQWVFGKDRALFEGFTSHVGRKMTAALTAPRPYTS